MIDREVYPNAPVVYVVLQVRHAPSEPLSSAHSSALKRHFSADLPIMRTVQETQLVGVVAPGLQPEMRTESYPKFFDRASGLAVSVRSDSITVETTRYKHFELLRDLTVRVLDARHAVSPIDGVERVGLRYVDELRAPHDEDGAPDWRPWVNPVLTGVGAHAESLGLQSLESQCVERFAAADSEIILRYGARTGYAFGPDGDLRRPTPPPGPYFLIDIDSFWAASDEMPAFEDVAFGSLMETLHSPVRDLFETLITPRLREEVLRHG